MGYSIYVVTRKEKEARKLDQYLRKAIDPSWMPNTRLASSFDPPAERLSYSSLGKAWHQLGFDHSCTSNLESAFMHDIIKWMAKVLRLTTYVADAQGYIKIEGKDAQLSLTRAYEMKHVDSFSARLIRRILGPTKKQTIEAKKKLQKIKDDWRELQ